MTIETKKSKSGDVEILADLPGGTYQMVWEMTRGKGGFNPDGNIEQLISGNVLSDSKKNKLLFGTHLNGVCPADCTGCPFGRTVMKDQKVLARPITPSELLTMASIATNIRRISGIYSAGFLLSGDPGYSKHTLDLIVAVGTLANCGACRWSTIAPHNGNNVLNAFVNGATRLKAVKPDHVLSFQVSLHSTDHQKRVKHTGVKKLLPHADIAAASKEIFDTTGRKLSLAFVLHHGSEIDPQILKQNYSPEHTMISLRPIHSSKIDSMKPEKMLSLYHRLRENWDVVFMPASTDAVELDNMRATGD